MFKFNDSIKFNKRSVKMVAHRGLSAVERENTCPAFVAAANRSYFGIETDVHKTSDGVFVVVHDDTLTRVSNKACDINVEKSSFGEIRDIVLPDLDGSMIRRDIRVPLLSEYISICKKYEKVCVLELKNEFVREDIERMVGIIRNLEYLDSMIFISFVYENCVILRDILPEAKIQFLTGAKVDGDLIAKLKAHRLDLDIAFKSLDKKAVDLLHSEGIEVNCWTVDLVPDGEALAEMGVDYITSDILE